MNRIEPSSALVRNGSRSLGLVSAGPLVIWMEVPSSLGNTVAKVVLPRPGRAVEEDVRQRLLELLAGVEDDAQPLHDGLLADDFAQPGAAATRRRAGGPRRGCSPWTTASRANHHLVSLRYYPTVSGKKNPKYQVRICLAKATAVAGGSGLNGVPSPPFNPEPAATERVKARREGRAAVAGGSGLNQSELLPSFNPEPAATERVKARANRHFAQVVPSPSDRFDVGSAV